MNESLRLLMVASALAAGAAIAPAIAQSHSGPAGGQGVFADALMQGHASAALDDPRWAQLVGALQRSSGSQAPIVIEARRIVRFERQPRCGRIGYRITQPATGRVWGSMSAQLNLCDDGLPPWRACGSMVEVLVPPNQRACPEGGAPRDTAEVAAAIRTAMDQGGLGVDEARARVKAANDKAAAAKAATAGTGSAR